MTWARKRNVHEWRIGCDAAAFMRAYIEVLVEPGAVFAGLTIRRAPGRAGAPFVVGEQFVSVFEKLPLARDRAEVAELELERPPYRARYRYLDGVPFVGASSFTIVPDGAGCRFSAAFEVEERNLLGLAALHLFGIRAHDRVLAAQVARAAARAGATVISTSVRS
jgi:hypothetical protein